MQPLPVIKLGTLNHHGKDCISIRFEKDFKLIREVKKIAGVKFSQTNRCWYVTHSDQNISLIRKFLMPVTAVDFSEITNTFQIPDTSLPKAIIPKEYAEQLERMRYSLSTKRTYISHFTQFLNHFPATSPDEISDEQVNTFMKYLVKDKQVAPSTQNQAINAIKFYLRESQKATAKNICA